MRRSARRLRAWLWALVVVIGALGTHARAHAAELSVQGPRDCVEPQRVREQSERLVGKPLSELAGLDFALEVSARGQGYVLSLQVLSATSGSRTREIEAASCDELTDAASVAIALAISEHTQSAPEAQGTPPAEQSASAPRTAPTEPRDDDALRVGLGAALLVESGAMPALALGAELQLALELRLFRAAVSVALLPTQEHELSGSDEGGAFELVLAALSLCAHPTFDRLELLVCGGFELGRMAAEGRGVADPHEGEAGWSAPRAELGVGYAFARSIRVWFRAIVAVPLSRSEFLLHDSLEVHRPGTLSLRGLLGAEIVL